MKKIWAILFLAVAAAIVGIVWLLIPTENQGPKLWLSLGGIGVGILAMFVSFAFAPGPSGEQGGAVMRGMMATASLFYFLGTLVLALIALSSITVKWLGVLHILALLFWIVLACFGALGATALAGADKRGQP
jgi:hypothetical protein